MVIKNKKSKVNCFTEIIFRIWCMSFCKLQSHANTGRGTSLDCRHLWKKVCSAGMLKHTFRSSKMLLEVNKNVTDTLGMLKYNTFSHRSHNLFSATVRSLTQGVVLDLLGFPSLALYIYTQVILKRNYSLTTTYYRILSFNKEAIIFSKWHTPAWKVFSLK